MRCEYCHNRLLPTDKSVLEIIQYKVEKKRVYVLGHKKCQLLAEEYEKLEPRPCAWYDYLRQHEVTPNPTMFYGNNERTRI